MSFKARRNATFRRILRNRNLEVSPVTNILNKYAISVVLSLFLFAGQAQAQYGDSDAPSASANNASGAGSKAFSSYVDVMFSAQKSKDDDSQTVTTSPGSLLVAPETKTYDPVLDTAKGISVLAGFRRKGWYGFEFGAAYAKDNDVQKQSLLFNTLIYPFENNLYIKLASGVTRYVEYPISRSEDAIADGDDDFITINYGAGIGYVLPVTLGNHKFGIRAEAVYHVADRFLERESDFEEDIRAPGTLKEVQLNIGIRFPL